MSRNRTANRILFAAALLVMLGVWPVVFNKLTSADPQVRTVAVFPHPAFANAAGAGGPNMIADVAERAVDSVVSIHTRTRPDVWGRTANGGGSGVIVSDDGLIVTNNHVIANMREISVTLSDSRRFRARVIGGDADSDLAVLKLEGNPRGLQAMRIGDSQRLRLGEVVLAIGNPFGVGQTVTMGIVSAKDRSGYVQTDAAINPGNSGGALVNMRGELVGINTMILSRTGGNHGIGFAIPSHTADPIVRELLQNGHISKPWLGVTIQTVNEQLADAIGLRLDRGVLVPDTVNGSPAAHAGLRRGDVIVEMNGARVDTVEQLLQVISDAGVGGTVDVEAVRDQRRIDLRVKLGDRNAPRARSRSRRR